MMIPILSGAGDCLYMEGTPKAVEKKDKNTDHFAAETCYTGLIGVR